MKSTITAVAINACLSCSAAVSAADGMLSVPSDYSVKETANRLVNIIEKKGLTLFARIDHSGNAQTVNLDIPHTEVVIFGNPKVGTPLMQCAQTVAIDLPQKALIWQDKQEKVWFSYNDPKYLKSRHSIKGCDKVIDKISTVLAKLSKAATSQ